MAGGWPARVYFSIRGMKEERVGSGNWSGQGDEQHASIDFSAAARCFLAVRFNRVSAVSSAAKEFPD